MSKQPDVMRLAAGKWPSILMHFGVEERFLGGKHGPCPLCGGKDRFRFIDKVGDGWWMCNQCGSGDGMDLLMAVTRMDFKQAANELRPVVGGCHYTKPNVITADVRKKRLESNVELWKGGIKGGVILDEYMKFRGLTPDEWIDADLKVNMDTPYYDEDGNYKGKFPAMLARVSTRDGKLALIHRTYLHQDREKNFHSKKKMTPSARDWKGGCIRLFPTKGQDTLIVAEGIETALSVRALIYRRGGRLYPCWAAVSANAMEKIAIPEHIKRVIIAADNDASFTGQKAAYVLANRLTVHDKRKVQVNVAKRVDTDFNDELGAPDGQVSGSSESERAVA